MSVLYHLMSNVFRDACFLTRLGNTGIPVSGAILGKMLHLSNIIIIFVCKFDIAKWQ